MFEENTKSAGVGRPLLLVSRRTWQTMAHELKMKDPCICMPGTDLLFLRPSLRPGCVMHSRLVQRGANEKPVENRRTVGRGDGRTTAGSIIVI